MTTPRLRRTLFTAFGLSGAMMAGSTPRSCSAQAAPVAVQAGSWLAPDKALRATMDTGKPTLVVITSQTSPASAQLMRSLRQTTATQAFGKIANLCELSAEQSPNEVKQLGVESYPTVVAYRRGAQGLEFAGKRGGIADAGTLLEWVQPQGLALPAIPAADRAVVATSYQDGQATPQNYPPATSPPAQYAPPPVQYAQPPAQYAQPPVQYAQPPAAYAPVSAPLAAYAPPAAPVVIHQQPATLILAPTPPPNIMHMAPAANLFAAPPAAYAPPPAAYASPPAYYAPAPPAYAPPPAYYAPAPPAYAPAPAAFGGGSAIILRGPGPIRSALGAFGRGLATLSNPTVQLNTSASFATMQLPAAAPAQYYAAPAPQYAPPQPPAQYVPSPSPQSAPCSRKFCRLLHHHDSE